LGPGAPGHGLPGPGWHRRDGGCDEEGGKRGDAPAIARALIAWARAEGSDARTLGELAHTLDATQRAASIELERYLYAANAETCDGARIAAAFRDGLAFIVTPAGKTQSALPPLYPFATKRSDESVQTLH